MHRINLRSVDLNLLVVLDALLSQRSVTRAAARLHLTQPAVSHALARLRALFDDPLLLRTPAGLVPTATADKIAPRLSSVLAEIGGLLAPDETFDPATARRHVTVGMSDYAAFVVLPALAAKLREIAPGIALVVKHTSHVRGLADLEAGEAELIVGSFPKPPARFSAQLLFEEGFACAARNGHPAFSRTLGPKAYLACDHLHVSLSGEPSGVVDAVLRKRKHRRNVALTVGHFLVAPQILAATDLVATEPTRLLIPHAAQLGLAVRPPPFAIPSFPVVQMWPRRLDADPALAFLRDTVAAVAKRL
ncbi:regulatory protein [Rhodovulum sp. PH10]|uniref:LysR family transcriptional regulator n=1 Tax=Rhodovulum sp. PH10 TaxID=1187851 RepID=UPI00027C2BA0|nr:LysR family transcriptional regulator [Rhodovulum sp. PH10]EJW10558.1 regulatory protein [Rhodovulum sp. PH10]